MTICSTYTLKHTPTHIHVYITDTNEARRCKNSLYSYVPNQSTNFIYNTHTISHTIYKLCAPYSRSQSSISAKPTTTTNSHIKSKTNGTQIKARYSCGVLLNKSFRLCTCVYKTRKKTNFSINNRYHHHFNG